MLNDPVVILLLGVAVVVGGILVLRLHAFLALVLAALLVSGLTPQVALQKFAEAQVEKEEWSAAVGAKFPQLPLSERVAQGFGDTCSKVGVLVALASIVGACLLASGAADRIVRGTLRWCGQQRASVAFVSSGFVLGIPVFFDTVFYLMIPLAKALRLRTGGNYLLYVLSITAGATMTHSLVPPTPGPLFVARTLGVDLGTMILGGCLLGIVTATTGYLFALWVNRHKEIPLRPSPDMSVEQLEELADRDIDQLPPLWLSLVPIVLPVVLIAGKTIIELTWGRLPDADRLAWHDPLLWWARTLGEPNLALACSAVVALATAVWRLRMDRIQMALLVQKALLSAGEVILITGAGGAFGMALRQAGIADRLAGMELAAHLPIVLIAFLITMLVRTAQGSATVAMMTAVSIVEPLLQGQSAACNPLYVALAIGCGSKPFAWMNDSGFWVISKMSGMTEAETLQTITPMSALMGFAGLAVVLAMSLAFPMLGM